MAAMGILEGIMGTLEGIITIITDFTALATEVDLHLPPFKPLSIQWPLASCLQQSWQESIPSQVTKCPSWPKSTPSL